MLDRLLQLIQTPDSTNKANIMVANHLCLNIRSGRRLCQACEDICPVQGIQQNGKLVEITACISCGLCAVACPTGVLDQLWNGFVRVINLSRDKHQYIWLTCHKAGPFKNAVRINCLGELTPELIFYLLNQGIDRVNIYYQPELCQDCQCQTGQANWVKTLAKLKSIYPSDNDCLRVHSTIPESAAKVNSQLDYSRREALRSLGGEAKQIMRELIGGASEIDGSNRFAQSMSLRRKLFRYVVSHLEPEKVEMMEPGYLRHPEINEECTFCGSCTTLCPSGAMSRQETPTGFNITVDPTVCNMCGLCADICPAYAITVDWTIPNDGPAQRMVLARSIWKTCNSCNQRYPGNINHEQSLCPGCSNSHSKPKLVWSEIPE
jgi:ferredoxin